MTTLLKWLNLCAFVAMIVVNALANILPLGGHTTGQVSENYPNLFTPAPFTFAIWGAIYLLLGIYIIMQLGSVDANSSMARVRSAIGILFILSCLFNIAWIFSWHFSKIGLSVICMLLLLFTLIIINMRLRLWPYNSIPEGISVYAFNLYLGWISAATIANISVYLVKINWTGFGISSIIWTLIVIAVGTILGICFATIGHRYFAALAVMWAFFGIFMKQISSSNPNRELAVAIGAIVALSIILLFTIISLCTQRKATY